MRVLRQPVVRDPKRLHLCLRQVSDLDDGNALHPQLLCGKYSSVPDDDMTGIVDHHGHDEAEFPDAIRDLVDLALRMLPRIAGIQDEIVHIAILNLDFDQAGVSCRSAASF